MHLSSINGSTENGRLGLGQLGDGRIIESEMGLDEVGRCQSEPL
jgi:hypothetical protein